MGEKVAGFLRPVRRGDETGVSDGLPFSTRMQGIG